MSFEIVCDGCRLGPPAVFVREVHLLHNPSGERRIYRPDDDWSWNGDFIWTEGYFACDYNRGLFWLWAIGEYEAEDDPGTECGDSVFTIEKIILSDGTEEQIDDMESSG